MIHDYLTSDLRLKWNETLEDYVRMSVTDAIASMLKMLYHILYMHDRYQHLNRPMKQMVVCG